MILFLSILTLFLFSLPTSAQEFHEYSGNPVVSKTGTSTGVAQPSVLSKDGIMRMWFADSLPGGLNRISLMKSANGIDWYDKQVLSVSNKQTLTDPCMYEENGVYTLYFAAVVNGAYSIWKSNSSDGELFTPGQESLVLSRTSGWEQSHVSSPSYIRENNIGYLFYSGANGGTWSIGMATSSDGITWQRCPTNPFIPNSSGPHIIKQNGVFSLFYRASSGLQVRQAPALNGCSTEWSVPHALSPSFSDPAPIQVGNELWLYGFSNTSAGQTIYLAGQSVISVPEYPVVIIPGMFASWNKAAILHNEGVLYDTWKLNSAVSEYTPLQTVLGSKATLFPYDWRQPILNTAADLDSFLQKKFWDSTPYQPIQLVGHSLGGVVSRIYADKNPSKPIKRIITAGSPHLGLVQAYKPLNSGEIDREDTLMWLAQKLILNLSKPLFQTEKEAMTQKFPVLFDLLPTFPFLKNEAGLFITSPLVNLLSASYPVQSHPVITQTYIGGSGIQTRAGYTPSSSWTEDGDGLVVAKSALNQITPAPLQNHGEVLYTKEGVETILSKLNISYDSSSIPLGKATNIFPALFVFLQSPATAQITHNSITTSETDGMIWLQNAENGVYTLTVTGTGEGEYTVSMWLIGAQDDKWIQFKKNTTNGKSDTYSITFNDVTGGSASEYIPPTPTPTTVPTTAPTPTQIQNLSDTQSSSSQQTSQQSVSSPIPSPFLAQRTPYSSRSLIQQPTHSSNKQAVSESGQKILGVSTKTVQKKDTFVPYYVSIASAIALLIMLIFKRKELGKWIKRLIKKMWWIRQDSNL